MEFSLGIDVHAVSNHNDRVRMLNGLNATYFLIFRYGNLVPRTQWGKIVTMMYAVCGIPVYILYFMNMGKVGNENKYIANNSTYIYGRCLPIFSSGSTEKSSPVVTGENT